jgi:hypothetical protein
VRSSRDRAPGWRRSPETRRPHGSAARSAARPAPQARTSTTTRRPASPGRAPRGPTRRRGSRRRTRTSRSPQRRRAPTMPNARKPLTQARRQQQLPLAITRQEVPAHQITPASTTPESSKTHRTAQTPPKQGLCDSLRCGAFAVSDRCRPRRWERGNTSLTTWEHEWERSEGRTGERPTPIEVGCSPPCGGEAPAPTCPQSPVWSDCSCVQSECRRDGTR